ncbi:hypothetical protein SBF1_9170002 [Candidatus Desulfosporosinus infrequens]|uniref:Uncharacterized protein n=1 Tax=Candidatus Desulfosporosinus infrequens TaxID=2043169 RepID=A0A2U3LX40_9FIRM|nr:hypothetical protein SBF1_9170002 [Candidatus Desulfosporosinus infrequens]
MTIKTGGIQIMRNRQKQRENRKIRREESLDMRNDAGYFDLTAFCAVARIREMNKQRDKPINVRPSK